MPRVHLQIEEEEDLVGRHRAPDCTKRQDHAGDDSTSLAAIALQAAQNGEIWRPDEFLDGKFFFVEEKAAVAANSESAEEDGLGGLFRRLAYPWGLR